MSQKTNYCLNRRLFSISVCILLAFFVAIRLLGEVSYAANQVDTVIECDTVPDSMQPGTILIFNTTSTATIIQGGFPEEPSSIELPVQMRMSYGADCIQEAPPAIYPGMKVVYDEHSGLINNILYPDSRESSKYSIHNIPDEISTQGNITYGLVRPEVTWKWGASNNVLTYNTMGEYFYGTGRATYFNDKYGNRDNLLKPYDLATKMAYDSSKRGDKDVVVCNLDSGASYIYYQADVGGMPDAIIDIWGLDNIHELAESDTATSAYNVSYFHNKFSDQDMSYLTIGF